MKLEGMHHITMITGGARKNVESYADVLDHFDAATDPARAPAPPAGAHPGPADQSARRLSRPRHVPRRLRRARRLPRQLWQRTGIAPAETVFGGFSMGSVMSYSLGLAGDRPAPAGILAFSGFIPTVDGWAPDLASRPDLPVFIAHGRRDPIMDVEFARRARTLLEAGGLPVSYHESDAAHHIDPAHVPAAVEWLDGGVSGRATATAEKAGR